MPTISRLPFTCAVLCALAGLPGRSFGYETDQFSNRLAHVEDSTEVLNRKVNQTLEEIVAGWDKGHDRWRFVNAVYGRLGGHHWVDKLERWAMKSPEVDKVEIPRYDSIYSDLPIWAVRVTMFFGIGKTIRVNRQLIGSDKLGHFFSQGRKFYRRYLRYDSEERAAKHSAYTERAIFGAYTTGSYSNADLVANYEGYRFYRSLFDDEVVPGKPAILRATEHGWAIQRRFDWADHVNAYWDEALNINHYDRLLYRQMRKRLATLCPQYWQAPSLFTVENEEALQRRYAHIGLQDTSELRLDRLCPEVAKQRPTQSMGAE